MSKYIISILCCISISGILSGCNTVQDDRGKPEVPFSSSSENRFAVRPGSIHFQIQPHDQPPAPADLSPLPRPSEIILNVTPQSQLPQLPNGCEVTSLSMLLSYLGHPESKMTLAREVRKAPQPLVLGKHKQIQSWGDPNQGFVGKINGHPGYGVYHAPITALLNQVLPGQADDLTNQTFSAILNKLAEKLPVVVWANTTFKKLPPSKWVNWQSPDGMVHATFYEHAVLLVGYSKNYVYINNPLNGDKDQPVQRQDFIAAWKQMGSQAVSVQTP